MDCPFCKKEMQEGYVYGQRGVYWREKKPGLFTSPLFDNSVVLADTLSDFVRNVKGYHCENCRKVMIDYNEYN